MQPNQKKPSKGAWIDVLFASVDKFINLETSDGSRRSGRLSGFRTKVVLFNGAEHDVPTELELNGDPTDTVALAGIVSVRID